MISGDKEAQLSFLGALSRVETVDDPVLVIDIGGGSTELITGSAQGNLHHAISLDIGSVRLTERFLITNPPGAASLTTAAAYVDRLLDSSGVDFAAVGSWIGVAGTVTTLSGVYQQLPAYDRTRVHGSRIPQDGLRQLLQTLSSSSLDDIRALPSMHPQRADVITGGALIAERIGARTPVPELLVSESDILDGIALELFDRG